LNQESFIHLYNVIQSKRLLFVTGKGGIGKTTISIAIAQLARSLGKRVLICENAAFPQVAANFKLQSTPQTEIEIAPGLATVQLTNEGNFREYVTKYLMKSKVFEQIVSSKILTSFFNALPGLAEAMLLGRIFYSAEIAEIKPDLIIFDAPASGHFLNLMTTPHAIIRSGLVGPLVKETKRVLEFLQDKKKCGIVFVGTPEELVVSEMIDFIPRIQEKSPVLIDSVIFNRDVTLISEKYTQAWQDKVAAAEENKNKFFSAAAKWNFHFDRSRVYSTPELGFIDEPLSNDFYQSLILETKA